MPNDVEVDQFRLNRNNLIQLTILILALPVQYLLTHRSTEVVRQYELNQFVTGIETFRQKYLNVTSWITWCGRFLHTARNANVEQETTDIVIEGDPDNHNDFGLSLEPRLVRPPNVKFRVGQVVKHRTRGFRGVIVGWDEIVKAPTIWLDKMRPEDKPHWRTMPNYAVLVDTRDRLTPQVAYVVEENIEPITNVRILHPLLDNYFEEFDGTQYIMRPWLKKVYPRD